MGKQPPEGGATNRTLRLALLIQARCRGPERLQFYEGWDTLFVRGPARAARNRRGKHLPRRRSSGYFARLSLRKFRNVTVTHPHNP